MSHFTKTKTEFASLQYLEDALRNLGYPVLPPGRGVGGYMGGSTPAEIKIDPLGNGFEIGFLREGTTGHYSLVADWWGLRAINRETLLAQIRQQYALAATLDTLQKQGFSGEEQIVEEDGRIRLTVSRWRE